MPWNRVWEHFTLVITALGFIIVIGVVLGVVSYLHPKLSKPILTIVDVMQTVPSLATLGIIMVFMGGNRRTVIIGIILYSLLPIVRNTNSGLNGVSPAVKEAARGMGMTRLYQLFHVDLPLAFPLIFTGIRIAAVTSISVAVFGTFVGGGGLGTVIYQGIRVSSMKQILFGTAALMAMALLIDGIMGLIEKRLYRRIGLQLPQE